MSKVKVVKMRVMQKPGNLKAFFTLSLGVLDVEDMKLLDGSNGLFIGFPSRKYEANGETKYADIVKLARNAEGKLTDSAKELYDLIINAATAEYEKLGGSVAVAQPDEDDDLPF